MVGALIQKYLWLMQTLVDAGERGLSLEEIQERWTRRFDTAYPRRSFNNHRTAIADAFGIEILCNRHSRRYYIPFSDEAADSGSTTAWLIDTFSVNSLLTLSQKRLSGRVSVENVPSGMRHLTALIDAMEENRELRISYRKYTSEEAEPLTVRPYALKESGKRWYLVAYALERKGLRVYGLDRILRLETTDRHFKLPEGFNVDELFADSYGVYLPDPGKKPLSIVLAARPDQAKFLRDLPLHPSQREDGEDQGRILFRLRLIPDENFYMDLCRLAGKAEILAPDTVRQELARRLADAADEYNRAAKARKPI